MFSVGMKVVCVDENWLQTPLDHETLPLKGAVYTIRKISRRNRRARTGFLLEEIRNSRRPEYADEAHFDASHFRPVIDRKTDITLFQQIDRDVFAGRRRQIDADQFDRKRVGA